MTRSFQVSLQRRHRVPAKRREQPEAGCLKSWSRRGRGACADWQKTFTQPRPERGISSFESSDGKRGLTHANPETALMFGLVRNRIARMKPARHYPTMPAGVARIERFEEAVEPLQNSKPLCLLLLPVPP